MATIEAIKDRFNQSVIVTGDGNATKTSTNYRFILAAGLRNQNTPLLNTRWSDWIGSAAFLFFDRVSLDEYAGGVPSSDQLISAAKEAELHKLVGGPEGEVMKAVSSLANSYRSVGGFGRNWAGVSKGHTAGIPKEIEVFDTPVGHTNWSDEAASEAAYIERRRREVQAQVRNPKNVNELKSLYDNKCFFCGHSVQIGVDPNRHYSEAAHIRPVGSPHSGSDRKDNMILLCPEHHLQFDRGILRIRWQPMTLTLESRIPGDPLHKTPLKVLPPHELARENVEWHYAYWS